MNNVDWLSMFVACGFALHCHNHNHSIPAHTAAPFTVLFLVCFCGCVWMDEFIDHIPLANSDSENASSFRPT